MRVFLLVSLLMVLLSFPAQADRNNGLVGWWKFEENSGAIAADSAGPFNGGTTNNGTLHNSPPWIAGHNGYALSFNGSNQYVSTTNVINIPRVTVSAWVYVTAYPSADAIVAGFIEGLGGVATDKNLFIDPSGNLYFYVYDGSPHYTSAPSSPIPLNQWVNVAGTADGSKAYAYVNGVQVGSVASGDTYTSYTVPNIFIDGASSGVFTGYLSAAIDDVRIYNRALSAAEVKDLYNYESLVAWWKFDEGSSSTAADSSPDGINAGALFNGPTWITGERGSALQFVKASFQYVNVADSSSLSPGTITVSAWIKVASNDGSYREIVRKASGGTGWFLLLNASNKITLSVSGNSNEYDGGYSYAADNAWHMVTGTFDGTTTNLYLDGVFQTSISFYAGISKDADSLTIGSGAGQYFDGSIDDVRVYDRALTAGEILKIYTNSSHAHVVD